MSDENMNLGTPEPVKPEPEVNSVENAAPKVEPGPAFQAYQQVPPVPPVQPVPPVPPVPPTGTQSQYYSPEPVEQGKGFSIASMVLGIVSLCLCCIWYLSIPCAIVGLALGITSMVKKYAGRGMAIAGVVCSGIGLILCVILLLMVAVVGVTSYNNLQFHF